jgi:hypothetical protein
LAGYAGGADSLSDEADVADLLAALPPTAVRARHHFPQYSHLDYGIGRDAPERLYPLVLDSLRQQLRWDAAAEQGDASMQVTA